MACRLKPCQRGALRQQTCHGMSLLQWVHPLVSGIASRCGGDCRWRRWRPRAGAALVSLFCSAGALRRGVVRSPAALRRGGGRGGLHDGSLPSQGRGAKACLSGSGLSRPKQRGFPDGSGRMRMHALPLLRGLLPCVFLPPGRGAKACLSGSGLSRPKQRGFPDGSGRMRMHALPLLRGLLPCVFLPPGLPMAGAPDGGKGSGY